MRTRVAAVQDPEHRDRLVQATVNINVDVLENERANHRISERAYFQGRVLQAVWERGSGATAGGHTLVLVDRGNSRDAHEFAIVHALENAGTVIAYEARVAQAIGEVGMRFLRRLLLGEDFKAYLVAHGRPVTERTTKDVGARFRDLLEDLAVELERGRR